MTAKVYLSQLQTLNEKINQFINEIDEIKRMMTSIRSSADMGDGVHTNTAIDPLFVKLILKLEGIESELNSLVDNYVDKRRKIIEEIQALENKNYMNLLYKRYVEGKRLELIAVEMNYSYNYIRRAHGKALVAFKKQFLF